MGHEQLTALLEHTKQSGSHLVILMVIALYSDPDGEWTVDQATLQKRARLSPRRTREVLAELIAQGELAVAPGDGRGKLSKFRLLLDPEKGAVDRHLSPQKEAVERHLSPQKGAESATFPQKRRRWTATFPPPGPPFPPRPPNPPLPPRSKNKESGDLRSPAPIGSAARRLSSQPAARRGGHPSPEPCADQPLVEDPRRHRARSRPARPAHPRRPRDQARAPRLHPPGRHGAGRQA